MKIVIGSDHAGLEMKREISSNLLKQGYEVIDCGTYSADSVDYPDIAEQVTCEVIKQKIPGILICGTGIGISIAANKIHGIRAALCTNEYTARLARQHNDANILALGSRVTAVSYALEIVTAFLKTDFEAGRHNKRVEKIGILENRYNERS
ncbi:MAG TPA: ribose 5-phosphate isomerase B [Syntrophomonadaceae bacterium]|nr:ribose 5-phosphate isomerase B [Syntrophomonadaceae bacterium]HPR93460.1 ribose 5-phosphate isomerase B [Syntrophomonadaceae bacterium]